MRFDEIREQVITLMQRQGRVSYPALKIRFNAVLESDIWTALRRSQDEAAVRVQTVVATKIDV